MRNSTDIELLCARRLLNKWRLASVRGEFGPFGKKECAEVGRLLEARVDELERQAEMEPVAVEDGPDLWWMRD